MRDAFDVVVGLSLQVNYLQAAPRHRLPSTGVLRCARPSHGQHVGPGLASGNIDVCHVVPRTVTATRTELKPRRMCVMSVMSSLSSAGPRQSAIHLRPGISKKVSRTRRSRCVPSTRFDPMPAGVVLLPEEALYRRLPIWIQVQDSGRWAEASHANTVVTDGRLLCRFASGHLASLWWGGIVGLSVDLAAEHIVLDFGDGQLVNLAGPREDEPEQHCDPSRGVLHAWVRSEVGHATSAMAATSVND